MSELLIVTLSPGALAHIEALAARAGMSTSSWIAEQLEHVYGDGRPGRDLAHFPRTHPSSKQGDTR